MSNRVGRPRKHAKHLPPCVFERHGAFYYVKAAKWERIGATLAEALAAYAVRVQQPSTTGALNALIEAAYADMQRHRNPPLAPNTIRQYRIAADRLKWMFREFDSPAQVKQSDAAQIKVLLSKTPCMANRVMSFARSVFAYAVENQIVGSNPFIGLRRHREQARARLITQAEFDDIYAKAGPRLRIVMDLLYLTGQRIDDVLNIKRADLIEDGIYLKQKKTGKELIVRWTPELRAVVERAKALCGNVKAFTLLHNRRGKAPDYRTTADQWRIACAKAGVENAHLHDVRAMAGTATQRQGKDAQQLLGHTDARTTRIYLRDREIPLVDGPVFERKAG